MLENKIVVIIGGTGLLGREFTKGVLDVNATAIIADIDETSGNKLKEELLKNKYKVDFFLLDIMNKDSIQSFIKNVHEKYGRIDAVVNSAYPRNKNYGKSFLDVSFEDFNSNVNMNLGGYFLVSQQFIKYFSDKNIKGNVINISSIYGVIAPRFELYTDTSITMPVEYSVIKSGLIHLTKYMAKYVKGKKIRVNSISPGGILDQQPKVFIKAYNEECLNKGMLDKSDITGTLIFLISDLSLHINGQNIIVDDGFVL